MIGFPARIRLYLKLSTEVARRSEANIQRAEEKKIQTCEAELANPFNPKADVSADAKYLWRNIFIWFWTVPVVAAIVAYLIIHS